MVAPIGLLRLAVPTPLDPPAPTSTSSRDLVLSISLDHILNPGSPLAYLRGKQYGRRPRLFLPRSEEGPG